MADKAEQTNKQTKRLNMNTKLMIAGLAGVSLLLVASGCSSITRGTPVAGTVIQANMNSGDCQVLGSTQGKATVDSYVLGLVQIIDADKVEVLGIKFFEDQYAFLDKQPTIFGMPIPFIGGPSIEDRAYYKALAATPDADAVAAKAWLTTKKGFPILWSSEEVTYQGKALKFKGGN